MHMKCSLHPDMHVSVDDCCEQSPSELAESISGADGSGHDSVSEITPAKLLHLKPFFHL